MRLRNRFQNRHIAEKLIDSALARAVQVYAAGMSAPKSLLIVYHSMTGGTRQMTESARAGSVADTGVKVRLLHASQACPDDVLAADGFIFATPENLAAMSGQLKDFFDRCYYAVLDRVNGRP